jgi:hypothetical protein
VERRLCEAGFYETLACRASVHCMSVIEQLEYRYVGVYAVANIKISLWLSLCQGASEEDQCKPTPRMGWCPVIGKF